MGWGLRVREGLLSGDFINRRLRCSQIYLLPLHPKSWDAPNKGAYTKAPVAELADALDLGSSVLRRAGSIPVRRTLVTKRKFLRIFLFFIFANTCNSAHYGKCTILFLGSITAEKMQIAPESLSRAINGNPQLSTIQSIAKNLNVEFATLFNSRLDQTDLTAIVVFRGKTQVTDNIDSLLDFATQIKTALQGERITENNINGKYHAK